MGFLSASCSAKDFASRDWHCQSRLHSNDIICRQQHVEGRVGMGHFLRNALFFVPVCTFVEESHSCRTAICCSNVVQMRVFTPAVLCAINRRIMYSTTCQPPLAAHRCALAPIRHQRVSVAQHDKCCVFAACIAGAGMSSVWYDNACLGYYQTLYPHSTCSWAA